MKVSLATLVNQTIELDLSVSRFLPNHFHGKIAGRVREIRSDDGSVYWIGDFCFGSEAEVTVRNSIHGDYKEYNLYANVVDGQENVT